MTSVMGKVLTTGLMVRNMRVIGKMTNAMVRAHSTPKTGRSLQKAPGMTTNWKRLLRTIRASRGLKEKGYSFFAGLLAGRFSVFRR